MNKLFNKYILFNFFDLVMAPKDSDEGQSDRNK